MNTTVFEWTAEQVRTALHEVVEEVGEDWTYPNEWRDGWDPEAPDDTDTSQCLYIRVDEEQGRVPACVWGRVFVRLGADPWMLQHCEGMPASDVYLTLTGRPHLVAAADRATEPDAALLHAMNESQQLADFGARSGMVEEKFNDALEKQMC